MSVLRTFRLMRLLKLLKSFPNLQEQLAVAGKTLGSTSWLFLLVFIFLVIFTILGMSQFAGPCDSGWCDAWVVLQCDACVSV